MNEPPIPFIAYILITITAGTLAYATITAESDDNSKSAEGSAEVSAEGSTENNDTEEEGESSNDFSENIEE